MTESIDLSRLSPEAARKLAAAMARLELLQRRDAFDPYSPSSQPTEAQQRVIQEFGKYPQQWIRAGNQSGKSQTCARLVSWVLEDCHPHWKRRPEWGEEPLLIIVAGRTGKQLEDSLLPKITSYLTPGTFKEVRQGNAIQRIELDNGNRVVFQSLENPNTAQQRLQSYVAHMVWIDELPPTMSIVRELLVRIQARNGYFLASFTPTVVNLDIAKFLDALKEPEGKVYRFNMLDNPLYKDPERKAQLLAMYAHLPQTQQDMMFRGEWLPGDKQVYFFDYEKMVEQPQGYSPLWRHVEAVDPALSSALGLTIWAENPDTHIWYCIHAEKIRDILVPTELVAAVRKRTERYNIVKRISDPHEVWYIQTAASMGITYQGVYKKNDRKAELIKQLQERMHDRLRISPDCQQLISEFQECRWSDDSRDRIVNSSSYHLLDSAQYFADAIPKPERTVQASSWQEWLWNANEQRKQVVEEKKEKLRKQLIRRSGRSAWGRNR